MITQRPYASFLDRARCRLARSKVLHSELAMGLISLRTAEESFIARRLTEADLRLTEAYLDVSVSSVRSPS